MNPTPTIEALDRAAAAPVLELDGLDDGPVVIESIELVDLGVDGSALPVAN